MWGIFQAIRYIFWFALTLIKWGIAGLMVFWIFYLLVNLRQVMGL